MSTSVYAPPTDADEVCFERDTHSYREPDGTRRMSTTQALKIAGAIDYSMVPKQILEHARWRGDIGHQATAIHDRGGDLSDYDIPDELDPFLQGHRLFLRENDVIFDIEQIEQPRIVEIAGLRAGMTPDRVGTFFKEPAVFEYKFTAAPHPAWALQTAGYEMGLRRPARFRNYLRFAVQFLRTGKYKLWPHEEASDASSFLDVYRFAAWKLKHGLAQLD